MSRFWSQVARDLTPYVPGEQPKIANLIKLNTNENPYPPSPRALAAIQAELSDDAARLRLYPDPNADLLKAAIAKRHAVTPQQVFVGNGSDEVLGHAFMALLKHEAPILFPDITYSFYPVYCGLYGVDYTAVPLTGDFTIDPADYCGRPNGGIIFPNPNAPTGCLLALDAIERILQANPDSVGRIAVEVALFVAPIAVSGRQPAGQAAHVAPQHVVPEGMRLRKQGTLALQRTAPLAHEIPMVERRAGLEFAQHRRGIDRRADRERAVQPQAAIGRGTRQTQREIAAQRIAGHHEPARRIERPHRARGVQHLIQPAGMEQALIQMMRAAVVAEVQREHIDAGGQQLGGAVVDIGGLHTAFPAVQQQRQGTTGGRRRGGVMHAGQTHAAGQVEDAALAGRAQGPQARQTGTLAPGAGTQH